jgi:predicted HD superfamily hydrolase involved in NAD metabolism
MMTTPAETAARYTPDFEERVSAWALAKIPPKRHAHVKGVVATVDTLARRYMPDEVMRARLAGWIHDAAKHWSDKDLLECAESRGFPVSAGERDVPMLLHGLVGYILADDVFGLNDDRLRSACALHTTGAAGMNTLDKIVFLGDLIEPGRVFPDVERLRREAERDLDAGVLLAADVTLRYLIDKGRVIDPRAFELRNELVKAGVRYEKI